MKCAVGIFAKTIGLSPVKTRLAADIGKEKAEEFYRLSVDAVAETMTTASRSLELYPHWALGEKDAPGLSQWNRFPAIWTGEGGLGTRLANVSEYLFQDHDAVILIGSDSPQLPVERLQQAIDVLKSNPEDCVVGPAVDGGFYLLGCQVTIDRVTWEAVTYSSETTLEELKKISGRRFHSLSVEQDVDSKTDLGSLRKYLHHNIKALSASQSHLLEWLNDHLDIAV